MIIACVICSARRPEGIDRSDDRPVGDGAVSENGDDAVADEDAALFSEGAGSGSGGWKQKRQIMGHGVGGC